MPKLAPFVVHAPTSVAEACDLAAALGPEATFYAGGTELLLAMKLGAMSYSHLIDIKYIDELGGIHRDADGLHLGSATTHREVERSDSVNGMVPALARAAGRVGNARVRASGTVGGNISFAEPRSDITTMASVLQAECEIASAADRRRVPVDSFLVDAYETALGEGELLVALHVPPPGPREIVLYEKFQFQERPTVGVAVCCETDDEGSLAGARVSVGAVCPVPTRCLDAERLLAEGPDDVSGAAAAAAAEVDVVSDAEGGEDYKRHLIEVLVTRLLGQARDYARAGSLP